MLIIRKAFRMSIHPGQEQEDERRHRATWRALEGQRILHGVRTYSILLDRGTADLFAYVEIESEGRWAAVTETDGCRR